MQNYPTLPATPVIETSSDAAVETASDAASDTSAAATPWPAEVSQLLARAAELGVAHGLDLDSFMKVAWSAYVESRPGMREHLEEMQLREQFAHLRKLGRLGEA